jgi:hypothetical protein
VVNVLAFVLTRGLLFAVDRLDIHVDQEAILIDSYWVPKRATGGFVFLPLY